MTGKEWLAKEIEKRSVEDVYDLLVDILITHKAMHKGEYSSDFARVCSWLEREVTE